MTLFAYRFCVISLNPYRGLNFSSCYMYIYGNITGNYFWWWALRRFWWKEFTERESEEKTTKGNFSRLSKEDKHKEDIYTWKSIVSFWFDKQTLRSSITNTRGTCKIKLQNQSGIFCAKTCIPLKKKRNSTWKYAYAHFGCLQSDQSRTFAQVATAVLSCNTVYYAVQGGSNY